jgi:hypothetical protein
VKKAPPEADQRLAETAARQYAIVGDRDDERAAGNGFILANPVLPIINNPVA